ncbi:MAG TPA: hypothetical protein VK487_03135 [Candidatus Bathyarchaeia archaeon]|nr:hypothetical protein [Candidatus Bathyarchaeia archaeon]
MGRARGKDTKRRTLRLIGGININDERYPREDRRRGRQRAAAVQKRSHKVFLSKQQQEMLTRIADKLGQSESEVLRMAFMEYARSISLITEKVHS